MAGDDFRAQVLSATDIVQLISENVALKRRGKDYVGLCPFHSEKTPSFHVSPGKQFFHCYGCKAGGNAIDFVIQRDRVQFIDALRLLGERAGLEMPKFGVSKQKSGERQQLLDAHSAACAFFGKLLNDSDSGQAARAYLTSRGFDEGCISRFQLGVAMNSWDALLGALGRKYPPDLLTTAGLVKRRENGTGYYDTFRNRLMFPIRDENARIIAFGGRVMPGSDDPAKYLNSPETPLFSKGRCVFGLDLARQKIVETRTVVIVEGYTDVMMAHQHGVTNVVSILGTALTERHVKLLQRFADKIVLLFDADTAGDKAVDKAVDLFLTQPIEIAIAAMPEGVDPDEFLMEHGAAGFEAVLAKATDALSYKWRQLQKRFNADAGDLTGQAKAVEQYLSIVANARGSGPIDPIRWGQALTRVSRLTEVPVEELNRRFAIRRDVGRPKPAPVVTSHDGGEYGTEYSGEYGGEYESDNQPSIPPPPVDRRKWTSQDRAERWLLGALLIEPHRWQEVQRQVHPADFADETRRCLAETYWMHQRDEGEPVFSEFLSLLDNSAVKQLAVELVEEAEGLPDLDAAVGDIVRHFAEMSQNRDERKLFADLRRSKEQATEEEGSAPADPMELLKRLQEKARRPDLRRVVS